MNDLIWIGNTLYPRWIVFLIPVLAVVGLYVFCAFVNRNNPNR